MGHVFRVVLEPAVTSQWAGRVPSLLLICPLQCSPHPAQSWLDRKAWGVGGVTESADSFPDPLSGLLHTESSPGGLRFCWPVGLSSPLPRTSSIFAQGPTFVSLPDFSLNGSVCPKSLAELGL